MQSLPPCYVSAACSCTKIKIRYAVVIARFLWQRVLEESAQCGRRQLGSWSSAGRLRYHLLTGKRGSGSLGAVAQLGTSSCSLSALQLVKVSGSMDSCYICQIFRAGTCRLTFRHWHRK